MSADVDRLSEKLFTLQSERNGASATRTKEDVEKLAEDWLVGAARQVQGTTSFVLNGHVGPAEVQAVLNAYLLESPALREFVAAKVSGVAEVSDRQKKQHLSKLDGAIATAERDLLAAKKAEAEAALEAEFAARKAQLEADAA
jgi:hypothetical protein